MEKIAENREQERSVVLEAEQIHRGYLILVNAAHGCGTKKDDGDKVFFGEDPVLASVDRTYPKQRMEAAAASALRALLADIGAGDQIVPVSGWRPHREQVDLYESSLKENGRAFTEQFVALPGHSEHETGLAMDVGIKKDEIDFICPDFPDEGIGRRFRERAQDFGFVERYVKGKEDVTGISPEPWHFRYVGKPHAAIMKERGFVLEEYLEFLKQFSGERPLLWESAPGAGAGPAAEIFYVPAAGGRIEFFLPECAAYEISGNNVDGCIVTIWRGRDGKKESLHGN